MPEDSSNDAFGEDIATPGETAGFRPETAELAGEATSEVKVVSQVFGMEQAGRRQSNNLLEIEVRRLANQCLQKDNHIHRLESQVEEEMRQRLLLEDRLQGCLALMAQFVMAPHETGPQHYMQAMAMMGLDRNMGMNPQMFGMAQQLAMQGSHRNADLEACVPGGPMESESSDVDNSSSSLETSQSWGQSSSASSSWAPKDDPRVGSGSSPKAGGRRSTSPGNASSPGPGNNWDSAKNAEWPLLGARPVNWNKSKNGKGEDNSNMVKLWTKRPDSACGFSGDGKWGSEVNDTRINVAYCNTSGEVSLLEAAQHNNVELIRKLVAEGVSVECRGARSNKTALMTASHVGNVKAVRVLLELKADPNAVESFDAWTPLHFATRNGHPKTLSALLDNPRTNPDATAHKGWTALHFAAYYGKADCARILLKHQSHPANDTLKTDINCPRYPGMTACQIADAQRAKSYHKQQRFPSPFM